MMISQKHSTSEQIKALKMVCDAVIEACAGDGAPSGTIYAALMSFGCSLDQFQSLMDALVALGKITRKGDWYQAVR